MLCSAPWLPMFRFLLDLLGIPAIAVPKRTPSDLSQTFSVFADLSSLLPRTCSTLVRDLMICNLNVSVPTDLSACVTITCSFVLLVFPTYSPYLGTYFVLFVTDK